MTHYSQKWIKSVSLSVFVLPVKSSTLFLCFQLQSVSSVSVRQRLTRGSGCSAAIALRSFQLIPIVQAGAELLSI